MLPTKRQTAKVDRWLRKWQRRLALQAWTFNLVYSDEPHPLDTPEAKHAATADPQYRYLAVEITFYPRFWEEPENEQERNFLHELTHVLTGHTRELILRRVAKRRVTDDEAYDANEQLTEWITNVVWRAYQ